MSSVGHPAKFLDCCSRLECNSSRLASVFSRPATLNVAPWISLPRFSKMSNYESFDWKERATKSFRMTKMRKQHQDVLIHSLFHYLCTRSKMKTHCYVNGEKIQINNIPDGLFLFYILSVLTRCPESMIYNPERIIWAKSWANISSTDEKVMALKDISEALFNSTVRRIEYYKASLKEFIAIIERR